jgi:Protein of unknown function (DUF2877)
MHAISADAPLLERLRRGAVRGSVHSVFTRAVNLSDDADGRLFTLVVASSDNAPSTLVVDTPSFERFALRPGAPAVVAGGALHAGDLVVHLDGARAWSASLPEWPAAGVCLDWLEHILERHGVAGGIRPRPFPANAFEAETGRRLQRSRAALHAALAVRDIPAVRRAAAELIGLGPGLTPAGDDYVLGLATAFALRGPEAREERAALVAAIDESAARTNDISHAALAHAARGRVRQSIVDLAAALAERDRATISARADRVLAIGATSGTDILTGLLAGLTTTNEGLTCP